MVELLEMVPELAGDIIIVVLFLYYLRSRDKTYDERLGKMTQLFTDTATEGHEVAGQFGEAISELRIEIARRGSK